LVDINALPIKLPFEKVACTLRGKYKNDKNCKKKITNKIPYAVSKTKCNNLTFSQNAFCDHIWLFELIKIEMNILFPELRVEKNGPFAL
jgi:hypothetical protein